MADEAPPLIDDAGIARLLAKLRAIRDHDPNYGLTKTEFILRAQEIAARQFLRERARQRRIARLTVPLETLLPHQLPALPDFVDRAIASIDLKDAIDRLSRHERQVVIQSYALKRPIREIALTLRLTNRAVSAIRRAATAKLRKPEPST